MRSKKDSTEGYNITIFRENGSQSEFFSCKKLPSGGSKQIYNLDGKEVIALTGNSEITRAYIQSEVDFSKQLREMGFRAQNYQMAEITIDNSENRIPVLSMPSFQFLAEQGQQIRDQKNQESSSGQSLVFGSLENMLSEEHWRQILTPLIQDMYLYFINGLDFHGDAWNAVIVDTDETKDKKASTNSLVITDLAQEIHFYFFDFGKSIIEFKKHFNCLDIYGDISEEFLSLRVNTLKDTVFSLIVHSTPIQQEYDRVIKNNYKLCTPVFEKVWQDISAFTVSRIKKHLESLSDEERFEQYATVGQKESMLYFRNLRLSNLEFQLRSEKKLAELESLKSSKFADLSGSSSTEESDSNDDHSEEMNSYINEFNNYENDRGFSTSQALNLLTDREFVGYLLLGIGGSLLIAGLSVATAGLIVPAFGALVSTVIIASVLGVTGGVAASTGVFALNSNRFFTKPVIPARDQDTLESHLSFV
ncbi:MAG: hypothetical protein H0U57_08555 [Tatlockia sp.]|nr:hypothetical protein [Tatlockia sp.]